MQTELNLNSSSLQTNSGETEQLGWAIGDPSLNYLTNSQQSGPNCLPAIDPQQFERDQERLAKAVSFQDQHAFVAAAAARKGHQNSVSRQLDLLPQSTASVSGELAWSNVPLTATYKRLPAPPTGFVMDPAQTVELAELPRELSDILAKYDTDADGFLDGKEVLDAVKDMELMEQVIKSGRIPFSAFPLKKQKMLRKHDTNQDGEIDVTEIIHGFEALGREKRRHKQICYFITGLVLFSFILLIGMCGSLAYIRRMERNSDISGSKMYVKGSTTEVVQMSSSLFEVKDGVLVDRSSGKDCVAGQQCTRPLSASLTKAESKLSSIVADEDLQELKNMKVINGDSWIFFRIRSVARYQESNSRFGTVVVLYTHIGEIQLDGEDLFFTERVAGAFEDAGFRVFGGVGSSRRRLLGVVEVIGLFNSVPSFVIQDDSPAFGNGTLDGVLPFSGNFVAHVTKMKICGSGADCMLDDGEWATGGHMQDTSDYGLFMGKAWVWEEEQTFVTFPDPIGPILKNVVTSEQHPEQRFTTLRSLTHKMTFQNLQGSAGWNFHCHKFEDQSLARAMEDGGSKTSPDPGIPSAVTIEELGYDDPSCGGVRCRKYRVTPVADVSGNPTGLPLDYWEHFAERRVFQVKYANVVYRFNSLSEDGSRASANANSNANANANGEFEWGRGFSMADLATQCNNPDLNWPPLWVPGQLTNVRPAHPSWGLPRESLEYGHLDYFAVEKAMSPAGLAAHIAAQYSMLSPTEEAARVSRLPAGVVEGPFVFCKSSSASEVGPEGFRYSYTFFVPCDLARQGERGPVLLAVDLDAAQSAGACFQGTGVATILRNGPTIITAGSLALNIDVLSCFGDQLDEAILANIQHRTALDPSFSVALPATLELKPGSRSYYESPASCAAPATPQLGYLAGAAVFNATTEIRADQLFQTSQQKELVTLSSVVKVEALLVSSDQCGSQQPANDREIKIGFRLGFKWTGDFVFNLCRRCAPDADCSPRWRVCGANEAPEQTPFHFDMYRQVFPGVSSKASADNCQTDAAGTYRYQCYQPEESGQGYTPWDCEAAIGFRTVPGSTCSPSRPRRRSTVAGG